MKVSVNAFQNLQRSLFRPFGLVLTCDSFFFFSLSCPSPGTEFFSKDRRTETRILLSLQCCVLVFVRKIISIPLSPRTKSTSLDRVLCLFHNYLDLIFLIFCALKMFIFVFSIVKLVAILFAFSFLFFLLLTLKKKVE